MPATAAKTYRARNMNEALATVKSELGPEAVILSARRVRTGLLGLGGPCLEVQAAPPKPPPAASGSKAKTGGLSELQSLRKAISQMREELRATRLEGHRERDDADRFADRFRSELTNATSTLRSLLAEAMLGRATGLPDAQVEVIRQLTDNGVEAGNAEAIVRSCQQDADDLTTVRRAAARFLVDHVPTARPLPTAAGRRVAAFVGPTGVGKTTTIAKVAAACVAAGRRVGIITTDTYRIAAVNQLKVYADCMELPLAVADSPDTVRQAIERYERCHVVLIDTAGVSPRATERIQHLSAMLSRAWISEVHLVLAAGTGPADLSRIRSGFAPTAVDHVVVTKLDETFRFGLLFNAPLATQAKLSYLSAGQRVPEDLEVATPERVARLILSVNHSKNGDPS